jgi:hypothetical protein
VGFGFRDGLSNALILFGILAVFFGLALTFVCGVYHPLVG